MRIVRYSLTLFMIFSLACPVCAARQIYVQAGAQSRTADGSQTRPFRTIAEALKVVTAGDTVIVREGLYRESIRVPGGQTAKPVTIRAADGERVVLSGAVPVTGWKEYQDNIYMTVLDFRPERLLVHYRSQPVAREPDDGWWVAKDANDVVIKDPVNLTLLDNELVGGQAYIWTSRGNTYYTVPVARLDRSTGTLTVERESKWMQLTGGDRYYLKNHPSLIDSPGDWAVLKHGDKWQIYFWPVALADLEAVEAPCQTQSICLIQGVEHVRISGLEITSGAGSGVEIMRSGDVVIRDCILHNHGNRGLQLRDVHDVTVQRCICLYNTYGVILMESEGVIVEENEIGHNGVDGLIISWNSSDITVRRNYIHHHVLWGHPDNVQLFREVKNIRLIDNLLLGCGQSIMMQETTEGLIQGNMIIGSMAYSVIFGHNNAENYRIYNNTIAFSGLGCMSLTAHNYDVKENVFMTGQGSPVFGVSGVQGYEARHNLFFNAPGLKGKTVMVSDRGRHRNFTEYRRATGYDQGSVFGDPRFRNAPVSFAVIDGQRISDCSRERLYLRKGVESIRLGDFIEVNFDGVLRRVVDRSRETITISPALPSQPLTPNLICCWGRNSNLSLDLRLKANSPGAKLSASGGPIGSTIDIAAYQRGDFDANGQRDLPRVPSGLEPEKDHAHKKSDAFSEPVVSRYAATDSW